MSQPDLSALLEKAREEFASAARAEGFTREATPPDRDDGSPGLQIRREDAVTLNAIQDQTS